MVSSNAIGKEEKVAITLLLRAVLSKIQIILGLFLQDVWMAVSAFLLY